MAPRLEPVGVEPGAYRVEDGEVSAREGDARVAQLQEMIGDPQLLVGELELRRRRVAAALGGQSGIPSRSISTSSGRSWARQRA